MQLNLSLNLCKIFKKQFLIIKIMLNYRKLSQFFKFVMKSWKKLKETSEILIILTKKKITNKVVGFTEFYNLLNFLHSNWNTVGSNFCQSNKIYEYLNRTSGAFFVSCVGLPQIKRIRKYILQLYIPLWLCWNTCLKFDTAEGVTDQEF